VPLIVVDPLFRQPRPQRQNRLRTVQRLHLRLQLSKPVWRWPVWKSGRI
jgi:hypothetical protein